MNWYSFHPQDTLFFRGAEPSNIGESHTASAIFPPPAQTIAGAVRTAVLLQNGVSFQDYGRSDFNDEKILKTIGRAGEESPFSLKGPFFLDDMTLWVPCPYLWFKKKEQEQSEKAVITCGIIRSALLKTDLIQTGSGEGLRWARGSELESLGGNWVTLADLIAPSDEKKIRSVRSFCVNEPHTGIALDVKTRRNVRKHHIYSFIHTRLQSDVKLAFAIDGDIPLDDYGVIKIGAEQRFGQYERFHEMEMKSGTSGLFMTLSILSGDGLAEKSLIATGRIIYLGGWDLHRGFHKPMKGFFPAGTVFDRKINVNCIEL